MKNLGLLSLLGFYSVFLLTENTYATCNAVSGVQINTPVYNYLTLSWLPNQDAISYGIRYKKESVSTWTTIDSVVTPSFFLINGLQDGGIAYNFEIRANCAGEQSSYTISSFTTAICDEFSCNPHPPCSTAINRSVENISASSVKLKWGIIGATGQALTLPGGYIFKYKKTTSTDWFYGCRNIARDSFADINNLIEGTIYEFQVSSICGSSFTGYTSSYTFSPQGTACPAPSAILTPTLSSNLVSITWGTVPEASGGYETEYKLVNGSNWTNNSIIATNSISYTNLNCLANYDFRVKSICTNTTSATNSMSFTVPCSQPSELSAASITQNSASISWSPINCAIAYYPIYRAIGTATYTPVANTFSGIATNSFALTNLLPNTQYFIKVRTNCPVNNSFGVSSYTDSISFTTLQQTICENPSNVSVNNITGNSAVVDWNDVIGANDYYVEYSQTSTTNTFSVTANTSTTTLSNLLPSTNYQVKVLANCGTIGSSGFTISTFTTSVRSSIHEQNNSSEFVVLPNPNNGFFTIESESFLAPVSIKIQNIVGEVVFSSFFTKEKQQFDLQYLPKGIYFISFIKDTNFQLTKKLTIEH